MTSKERSLAVMQGKKPDRAPIAPLMMFFAADRVNMPYKRFVLEADALVEAQLNLYENYHMDVITVCSDAFRVSADMGAQMDYPENQTPHLVNPLVQTEADFKALKKPDIFKKGSRMRDRLDAVEKLKKTVGDKAMIMGWIEMPFAEACDWCGVSNFMEMLYEEPELAHDILNYITDIEIEFALAQIEAGAPIIGCGDAAASLISPPMFDEFALPYEIRVNEAIRKAGGMTELHICGDTTQKMQAMAANGSDMYTIDHMVDFEKACQVYGDAGKIVKANVNPVTHLMQATPQQAADAAKECIRIAGDIPFMLSAGCEIPAATSDEVYFAFVETVL